MVRTIPQAITIRLARGDEGPLLHELFLESGKWEIEGVDWTQDMGPYWLIAEIKGVPWGCILVRPGRPLGSLEFLCVPIHLPHKTKCKLVRTLCYAGLASLKRSGSQLVSFVLSPGQDGWTKVLLRRKFIKWFTGEVFIAGL